MDQHKSERLQQIDGRAKALIDDLFALDSRTSRPGTVERAMQLARSGKFRSILEIRRALSKEGYGDARAHLDGRQMSAQLNALMTAARSE